MNASGFIEINEIDLLFVFFFKGLYPCLRTIKEIITTRIRAASIFDFYGCIMT